MPPLATHSTAMECPRCTLLNPPGTLRCDCGYRFEEGEAPLPLDERTKKLIRRWQIKLNIPSNISAVLWVCWSAFALDWPRELGLILLLGTLAVGSIISWVNWRYHPEWWFRERKSSTGFWSIVLSVFPIAMLWITSVMIKHSHADQRGLLISTIGAVALVGMNVLIDRIDKNARAELQRQFR